MTVRRNPNGSWMIDIKVRMPNGSLTRIRKVSPVPTKRGALEYERQVRDSVLDEGRKEEEGQVPRFAKFADFFIETYATTNNRPSTVREKRRALGRGHARGDGASTPGQDRRSPG